MTEQSVIFDIQKFSIHDGPGIRTLIFLKGCPLHCLWCSNPEGQSSGYEIMYYPEKCIGCQKCLETCKHGAISLQGEKIIYNRAFCQVCGDCTRVCPSEARKLVGRNINVNELLAEIEKDTLFYINSGGGITFGGGEPLLYPDFIKSVAKEAQERGINVAIETCGYYPWANLAAVIEYVDLIMFDLKHMNAEIHEKLCGQSNELIINNLINLCSTIKERELKTELIIRVPIIPSLNDSEDNIRDISELIFSLGSCIKHVELLPYHKYGVKKYERLEYPYDIPQIEIPSEESVVTLAKIMEQYGLAVKIGG